MWLINYGICIVLKNEKDNAPRKSRATVDATVDDSKRLISALLKGLILFLQVSFL